MSSKIIVKKPGSPTLEEIETELVYRGDLKEYVGGDPVEMVQISNDGLSLLVDENGMFKRLPHNFFLSFDNTDIPIQTIIGNAVFARFKPLDYSNGDPWDYELCSLTDKDIEVIKNILREDLQETLKKQFLNRYGSVEEPHNYWQIIISKLDGFEN